MSVHRCHAIGCEKPVPPRMLFCLRHWRLTPRPLQLAVWRHYVPGQEIRKDPSEAYLQVMSEAIAAVAAKEGKG